jgi:hypothetical protein
MRTEARPLARHPKKPRFLGVANRRILRRQAFSTACSRGANTSCECRAIEADEACLISRGPAEKNADHTLQTVRPGGEARPATINLNDVENPVWKESSANGTCSAITELTSGSRTACFRLPGGEAAAAQETRPRTRSSAEPEVQDRSLHPRTTCGTPRLASRGGRTAPCAQTRVERGGADGLAEPVTQRTRRHSENSAPSPAVPFEPFFCSRVGSS